MRTRVVLAAALVAASPIAPARAAGGIYTCGTMTSDRPFADCPVDQLLRNPDGSTRRIVPRPLTEEEKEQAEDRRRKEEAARSDRRIEERRIQELVRRYPDEASHARARQAALDETDRALANADRRIAELTKERSKLLDEKEFYIGKPLPPALKAKFDANDASLAARRAARVNLVDDRKRIEKNFDDELATLRKHWRTPAPGKPALSSSSSSH